MTMYVTVTIAEIPGLASIGLTRQMTPIDRRGSVSMGAIVVDFVVPTLRQFYEVRKA